MTVPFPFPFLSYFCHLPSLHSIYLLAHLSGFLRASLGPRREKLRHLVSSIVMALRSPVHTGRRAVPWAPSSLGESSQPSFRKCSCHLEYKRSHCLRPLFYGFLLSLSILFSHCPYILFFFFFSSYTPLMQSHHVFLH